MILAFIPGSRFGGPRIISFNDVFLIQGILVPRDHSICFMAIPYSVLNLQSSSSAPCSIRRYVPVRLHSTGTTGSNSEDCIQIAF